MDRIVYRFSLDTNKNGVQQKLQGFETAEVMARKLEISLVSGSRTFELPLNNVTALMYVQVPGSSETSVNACQINGDKIYYDVLESDTSVEGTVQMQLKVIETSAGGAERVIVSPRFEMDVWASDVDDDDAEDSPTFTALEDAIATAQDMINSTLVDIEIPTEGQHKYEVMFTFGPEAAQTIKYDTAFVALLEKADLIDEIIAQCTAQAEIATDKAEEAAVSASSASNSATSAHNNALQAISSATSAAASATSASNSASSASASASTAGTFASQASGYSTSASESAASASDYADSAQASATSATSAKNTAQIAASNATTKANEAAGSAVGAYNNAQDAIESAVAAESWCQGGTGTRSGEDTNNAKYWSDRAERIAESPVTGVKGDAEENYRIGDVNLTPGNIGAMSNVNPVGTGSFGLNRKANSVVGNYSFVEGYNCYATKDYAHAEGFESCAVSYADYAHAEGFKCKVQQAYAHAEGYICEGNGQGAHAEGWSSKAQNQGAHAEGSSTASGMYSHSEGSGCHAEGGYSHAEGHGCYAYDIASHAEGEETKAGGRISHAEGYGTYALGIAQHTQGMFNIIDESNKYLDIVGYGSDDSHRANIETTDKYGVKWLASDVRCGGNNQDDTNAISLSQLNSDLGELTNRLGKTTKLITDFDDYNEVTSKFTFVSNSFNIIPFSTSALHQPRSSTSWGFMIVYFGGDVYNLTQEVHYGDGDVYLRRYYSGNWTTWEHLIRDSRVTIPETNLPTGSDYIDINSYVPSGTSCVVACLESFGHVIDVNVGRHASKWYMKFINSSGQARTSRIFLDCFH